MAFLARLVKLSILIVFVASTAYFAVYNREKIGISLPPWIEHISVPGYLLFSAFFALGVLVATLYFGVENARKALEIRRLNRELAALGGGRAATARQTSMEMSGFGEPLSRSKEGPSVGVTS